jgi:parallel beta-helix repeat protein
MRLLIAVFLLYLTINLFPIPKRLSNPFVSANGSLSQYYIVHDPISVANDNELAAVANSGTGTVTDPYIITGWNITGSSTHGIYITGTKQYFRIKHCWIHSSNEHGIFVENVAPGTTAIINNTCNNNKQGYIFTAGIYIQSSSSSTVVNNTCSNNKGHGIALDDSESSTVANNTCNNNKMEWRFKAGIYIQSSSSSTVINNTCREISFGIGLWDSESSTVTNNTCTHNNEDGIYLSNSGSSMVANNTCSYNRSSGITLGVSDNTSLVWNALVGNGAYGVTLSDDSYNNIIHHNNFIANGQNTSQACDNGGNNQWYDETLLEGNYWSDYNGSYLIAGSAGASDPYPSLSPYRYTGETDSSSSPVFPQDVLVRIGFFLVIIGLIVVVFFVNRRRLSS